jgi:hypothetical protein
MRFEPDPEPLSPLEVVGGITAVLVLLVVAVAVALPLAIVLLKGWF